MKLLITLAFCKSDIGLAQGLLNWIRELGGAKDNPCLLVADTRLSEQEIESVIKSAQKSFKSVELIKTPIALADESWPRGANWMFQIAAQHISAKIKTPWLWLEPDAVPMREGWIQKIELDYEKSGKEFMGDIRTNGDPGLPYQMLFGVAVYPPQIPKVMIQRLVTKRQVAWDVSCAEIVVPRASASQLFWNFPNRQLPPTFVKEKDIYHPENALELNTIPNTVSIAHPSKDGSLINLLRESKSNAKGGPLTFYHSGDFGDIIYSLPAIKALGGGVLYIGPEMTGVRPCREPINEKRFRIIAPLLKSQPYMQDVIYTPKAPEAISYDLNLVRETLFNDYSPTRNIAKVALRHLGLDEKKDSEAWLTIDPKHSGYDIIISRSARYHNKHFPWAEIVKKYSGKSAFIGTQEEHAKFSKEFGDIPYISTPTLLEAAQIIASSKLFIGNQSSPYSIAEGLKHNSIQETYPEIPNCMFERGNAIFARKADFKLPEMKSVSKGGNKFVLRAPIDGFTGYGQSINSITLELIKRGYDVQLVPTRIDTQMAQVDKEILSRIQPEDTPAHMLFHTHDAFPFMLSKGQAVFTMWESTRIRSEAVQALNNLASVCVVPNSWNASCFNACGSNVRTEIVPLGVDTKIFKYKAPPKSSLCVFGAAGRFAHGGCRKGLEEVVQAFQEAFPDEKDVRLELKIFADCKVNEVSDPRITYLRKFMPWKDFVKWYSRITAFVSASKAEGWGLHHLQSMAIGRPLVACQFGGVAEFFDSSVGYPIDYKLAPCDGVYTGMGTWAHPSIESISKIMRSIYEDRDEANQRGLTASKRAARYSWKNTVDKLEPIIKELIT